MPSASARVRRGLPFTLTLPDASVGTTHGGRSTTRGLSPASRLHAMSKPAGGCMRGIDGVRRTEVGAKLPMAKMVTVGP
jgi:hypothetical protein